MISRLSIGRGTLIAAALVFAALATVVGAYWGASGSGSGQTQLVDPQQLVISSGTANPQLYPGSDTNVAVIASNPNPYSVRIATLALDPGSGTGGFDVDAGHGACNVSTLVYQDQDNGGDGWIVPPRAGSEDGTLSIDLEAALAMGAGAGNACQGATFTVYLTAGTT